MSLLSSPTRRRWIPSNPLLGWAPAAAGAVALLLGLSGCGGGSSTESPVSPPPNAGLYASAQYSEAQLSASLDQAYSTRPNAGGVQYTSDLRRASEVGLPTLTMHLDVWVPPNASAARPQPLVVWVHGGAFAIGSKEEFRDKALSYARAGYVAASINYRLTPENNSNATLRRQAVLQATEDLSNAVRYLRQNAARFHIDTSRVAIMGSSAGGAMALAAAVDADTLPGLVADYPQSARAQAVLSTGATLIDAYYDSLADLSFDASDSPVMLFHADPTDSTTGATWTSQVLPTAQRINDSGNSCTLSRQANLTHTVDLSLGGRRWEEVRPFLWEKLRLAALL